MNKIREDITAISTAATAIAVKENTKEVRAARLAQEAANKAAQEQARRQVESTTKLADAERERNEILSQQRDEQRETQQAIVAMQAEALQSRLREEQAEQAARDRIEVENKAVNVVWEILEVAKVAVRDGDIYRALIYGVNARMAYRDTIMNLSITDNKIKVSQLNQDACDVIDKILVKENIEALTIQGIDTMKGLRDIDESISSGDFDSALHTVQKSLSALKEDNTSIEPLEAAKKELVTLNTIVDAEQTLIGYIKNDFDALSFAFLPIRANILQEFLRGHAEIVESTREAIEDSIGVTIKEATVRMEHLNETAEEFDTLRTTIIEKVSAITSTLAQIRSEAEKADREAKNKVLKKALRVDHWILRSTFLLWIILVVNHQNSVAYIPFVLMIGYWIYFRQKRNKIKVKLGIRDAKRAAVEDTAAEQG